jgi:hypothetical protein
MVGKRQTYSKLKTIRGYCIVRQYVLGTGLMMTLLVQ